MNPDRLRTGRAPVHPTKDILSEHRDDLGTRTNAQSGDRVSASPERSMRARRNPCAYRYGQSPTTLALRLATVSSARQSLHDPRQSRRIHVGAETDPLASGEHDLHAPTG